MEIICNPEFTDLVT